MEEHIERLPIGTRVKLSQLGAARYPRSSEKIGTVVSWGRFSGSAIVQFDGNKTLTPVHWKYIEAIVQW